MAIAWLWRERDYEPALAVLAGLIATASIFANDERQKRKTARVLDREEKACRVASDRIKRERANFERMAGDPTWSPTSTAPQHQGEPGYVYPWEALDRDIQELKETGQFPLLSRRILRAIERRRPAQVLRLVDRLTEKLKGRY